MDSQEMDKPLLAYTTVLRVLVEQTLSSGWELFQLNSVKWAYHTRVQFNVAGWFCGRLLTQLSFTMAKTIGAALSPQHFLSPFPTTYSGVWSQLQPAENRKATKSLQSLPSCADSKAAQSLQALEKQLLSWIWELFGRSELPLSSPAISFSLSDAYLAFGAVWK